MKIMIMNNQYDHYNQKRFAINSRVQKFLVIKTIPWLKNKLIGMLIHRRQP